MPTAEATTGAAKDQISTAARPLAVPVDGFSRKDAPVTVERLPSLSDWSWRPTAELESHEERPRAAWQVERELHTAPGRCVEGGHRFDQLVQSPPDCLDPGVAVVLAEWLDGGIGIDLVN